MLLPAKKPVYLITRRGDHADVMAAAQKILVCTATRVECTHHADVAKWQTQRT
jgi:hypothetical protein